jgi:MATE family multidrug resistance protein
MSSAYADYQGHSSLPPGHAMLSALNNHHNGSESESSDPAVGHSQRHRESHPHTYNYHPAHTTVGVHPQQELSDPSEQLSNGLRPPSETTPLLGNPPVPRIDEVVDNKLENNITFSTFWEEFLILAKYSLPVFGYCISLPIFLDLTML